MPKMRIAVVPKPGADFEIQEREIPTPGQDQVRIKVKACGVCFGDHIVKDGFMPFITYPRSPGHEISGVVDDVGPGVRHGPAGVLGRGPVAQEPLALAEPRVQLGELERHRVHDSRRQYYRAGGYAQRVLWEN